MPSLDEIKEKIPAEIRMFSGCRDEQTSADVSNVHSFQLPDPQGRAGGACTSAMLNVLYADEDNPVTDKSFQEVLLAMREMLDSKGFSQIPQLSSSRPMNIKDTFDLVPAECTGTRRAVLIGINYVGQNGELSGCHNDVHNMVKYIQNVHGFEAENITLLLDDGIHMEPTRDNIMRAYQNLVASTQPGDAAFCHYSGHGGRLRDDDGDEEDGYDETLVPLDYGTAGQIRDDDLFKVLVCAMPEGSVLTSVMDCCHSGTVLDLPYRFIADGESDEMEMSPDFDLAKIAGLVVGGIALAAAVASGEPEDILQAALQCCNIL